MERTRIPIHVRVSIVMDSPFHVGGGKGVDGVCSYLLRDGAGNPYWPGSAFKGKVRHFARLLFESNGGCCVFDHALKTDINKTPCGCIVCDMLGSAGNSPGSLRFIDMSFKDKTFASSEMRTGNAIDRRRRVANDNSLFQIETVGTGESILIGEIIGTLSADSFDDQKALLEAAVSAIPHIGGNTGRGVGGGVSRG